MLVRCDHATRYHADRANSEEHWLLAAAVDRHGRGSLVITRLIHNPGNFAVESIVLRSEIRRLLKTVEWFVGCLPNVNEGG